MRSQKTPKFSALSQLDEVPPQDCRVTSAHKTPVNLDRVSFDIPPATHQTAAIRLL